MKALLTAVFPCLLLIACQNEPPATSTDDPTQQDSATNQAPPPTEASSPNLPGKPLYFAKDSIKRSIGNCEQNDPGESGCATASIHFLKAKGTNTKIAQIINDTLRKHLAYTMTMDPTRYVQTLSRAVDAFLEEYDSLDVAMKTETAGWTNESTTRLIYQNDKVACIEIHNYSYMGGAHPNSFSIYLIFDVHTGKRLGYTDLFVDIVPVEEIVKKRFLKEMRELADESLTLDDFFWGEGFYLPKNIGLTPKGILFHYNPYEAAAYVFGHIEFVIPYQELGVLLKKEQLL